jgi:hypothetical protein
MGSLPFSTNILVMIAIHSTDWVFSIMENFKTHHLVVSIELVGVFH